VMDAGNNGVIILADKMLPPRKHGVLIPGPQAHLMKLGFEKYFMWKSPRLREPALIRPDTICVTATGTEWSMARQRKARLGFGVKSVHDGPVTYRQVARCSTLCRNKSTPLPGTA